MCGVDGVWLDEESGSAAKIARQLGDDVQHRGQESAGMAVATDYGITTRKELGLVSHVSNVCDWDKLVGRAAIVHTRYSTKGLNSVKNACPIEVPSAIGRIAITYNGNLVNANQLQSELARAGFTFETTTDSEIIAQCLAYHLQRELDMTRAIKAAMKQLRGAYSIIVLTTDALYGFCDPNGIRPLCLGRFNGGYVLVSETCALPAAKAVFVREIGGGEIVRIGKEGVTYEQGPKDQPAMCVFEFIYVARPDSKIYGKNLGLARMRCGEVLAKESAGLDPEGAIVVPIPNTGRDAGQGYGYQSGLRVYNAAIKNRYQTKQRNFIQPEEADREKGVDAIRIIKEMVYGRPVVAVDDSIVRGSTKRGLVKKFRDAGATEVHVRIASPRYMHPCYFGVDTAERRKLIAADRTIEEIRQEIGADTLTYLSFDGLFEAIDISPENFCHGCLSGKYPMAIPEDLVLAKTSLE